MGRETGGVSLSSLLCDTTVIRIITVVITATPRWLLLIHAIPPKPDALRAKVGRRLARVGAVPIKNSVYLLPTAATEGREDLEWVRREVVEGGGECTVVLAEFVAGLSDRAAEALFREARDADYAALLAEIDAIRPAQGTGADAAARDGLASEVTRLRKRFEAIRAIDFFTAPKGADTKRALDALEATVRTPTASAAAPTSATAMRSATWVTRRNPKVDRLSSAWLIRRFIDPEARFRFVVPEDYTHAVGELRFDMFEGEYTHEHGGCTFETLCHRFALADPALAALGQIVHDLDVKDGAFGRPEAAGVALLIDGLVRTQADDAERVRQAEPLFDAVYAALGGAARR